MGRQQPIKSRYDDNPDMQISRLECQQPIKLWYDKSKQEMTGGIMNSSEGMYDRM